MDWCRHDDNLEQMQRFVLSALKGLIEVTPYESRGEVDQALSLWCWWSKKKDPERSLRLLLECEAYISAEEASKLLWLSINHWATNPRLVVTFLELGADQNVVKSGCRAIHAVIRRWES
jgi:hypothetical protein